MEPRRHSPRGWHGSVVFTDSADTIGKMWVLGGYLSWHNQNDVWWSADGKRWAQDDLADWLLRGNYRSVDFKQKIWLIGGLSSEVWYYPADSATVPAGSRQ